MRSRDLMICSSMFGIFLSGAWLQPCRGEDKQPTDDVTLEVKIVQPNERRESKQAVLNIKAHWKTVKSPSLVLLLNLDSKTNLDHVSPVQFKGDPELLVATAVGVAEQLHAAFNGHVDLQSGGSFDVLTWENCLHKTGGCIAGYITKGKSNVAAQASYFLIERFSIDDSTLQIEPPGQYFSAGGEMHVLFLEGKKLLWRKVVTLPGRKEISK